MSSPSSACPAPQPTPTARLEGVTYFDEEQFILRDVDWTILPGQHWALIGANGSGKTTLARMLSAYLWPSRGSIEVLGGRFGKTDIPTLRRAIGFVSAALSPRIPVEDVALDVVLSGLDAHLGLHRTHRDDERAWAGRCLQAVGLTELANRPWGVLSQGERGRVSIARALAARPKLLVLDEPCAGLDPGARADFLEALSAPEASLGVDAPCLVLVTHHVEEIPAFVGHALVLDRGAVVARGPIAEVLTGEVLGRAYGRPCRVFGGPGQWRLEVVPRPTSSSALTPAAPRRQRA